MPIDDDLDSLLTNPKAFLERNALVIFGLSKSGSGVYDFMLRGSAKTGWTSVAGGVSGPVPYYSIVPEKYGRVGGDPNSKSFSSHYISMREADGGTYEGTEATHYTLPSDGPALMVTSKLNGCTFGIGSAAKGSRLVSHLRPPSGAVAPARMALDRATRAGFAGGHLDVSVMSSQKMNGTVLALRNAGAWTFYAQRFEIDNAIGRITDVQVYK